MDLTEELKDLKIRLIELFSIENSNLIKEALIMKKLNRIEKELLGFNS